MKIIIKSYHFYFLVQIFFLHSTNAAGFDYDDTNKWAEFYPICGEKYQSPIDLTFQEVEKIGSDAPLKWTGYDVVPMKMTLTNNGHSITLTAVWASNAIPYIEAGPLASKYAFEQLHFHWGPNNSVGSEHTVNGNSFPLEMHMVHYNKKYQTFTNATNYSDGLAVVGLFFDLNTVGSEGLKDVLDKVINIKMPEFKTELDPFALSQFDVIPASIQLCTYRGSLTTPPCSQIVTWILPINTLKVTAKQMEIFRSIELSHYDIHNYRATQPLNGRTIYVMTQWSKFYESDIYKVLTS